MSNRKQVFHLPESLGKRLADGVEPDVRVEWELTFDDDTDYIEMYDLDGVVLHLMNGGEPYLVGEQYINDTSIYGALTFFASNNMAEFVEEPDVICSIIEGPEHEMYPFEA